MNIEDLQPGIPLPERPKPPAPLLPLALGLILGIVADSFLALPTSGALAIVVAGALLVLSMGRLPLSKSAFGLHGSVGFIVVLVSAAGVGSLRHAIADRWLAEDHVFFFTDNQPILAEIHGRVLTPPRIIEPRPDVPRAYPVGPKTRFVLEATYIAGDDGPIHVSGKVAVVVKGAALSLRAGDLVEMTGWVYRPPSSSNPGAYDWARHQRRRGLLVGMSCDHAESVIVLRAGTTGTWPGIVQRVRSRLRGYLLNDAFEAGDPGAGVIAAMVLGERSAVSQVMNEAFIKTGNAHFLAASGMHVGWLAMIGWGICRLLGLYYRTTAVAVGLLIVTYVLLAEPRPSIMRAGIIGLLACITIYIRGHYNSLNSLSLAAVLVLMFDPMDLFRPAFQYSFMAVLALLHLCPHVAKTIATCFMKINRHGVARSFDRSLYGVLLATPDPRPLSTLAYLRRRLGFLVAQLAALAASAWFITAPLSCYHFNNFTPMGWLQTLLLWFVAMPATLVGFITLFFGTLIPSSGLILGPILNALTNLMLALVQLLARMPGTIVDGRSPSIWWLLAVYAALWIWVYRRRWMPWRHGFKVLVVVLILWWGIPPRWVRAEGDALQVWVLDVGDGTGTVIELPGGQVLVYDFGTRSPFDAGAVGAAFFRHRGIRRLDAVFVSHPNFDHYGGLEVLAKDFTIGRVIINDQFERFVPEGSAARRFLNKIRMLGIPIQVTSGRYRFEGLGDVEVEAIWPPAADQQLVPNSNESSTVLRLTYQGCSILLTGDITEFGMGMLTADGGISADALLLPHHGSVVHNTGQFITAVDPQVAVRSSGQRRALTTNEIETLLGDVQYYNTADDGCVLVRIKNGELIAEADKPGP